MLTTDLALRFDPAYEKISRRFLENPDQFADAFAAPGSSSRTATWARARATSAREVPKETLIWQDPIPAVDHPLIDDADIAALKAKILASGLSVVAARLDRLGLGRRPSAAPTSAAAPMARASASRRRRTGRSTSRPSWPRCCRRSKAIQSEFNGGDRAARRSRWPT